MAEEYYKKVLKLSSSRVWRTYYGGKELDKWHGKTSPEDGELPEDWIASTVNARNPGRESILDEGLSYVILEGGGRRLLKALIEEDPDAFLGTVHTERFGSQTGVLVKMIDSLSRLTIQVHPDKRFAKEVLNSNYGKTESWYILGGREVNGEVPHVFFGFKPGITREVWQDLFNRQDIPGMLNSLHKIPVNAGDVFFIEGGVPHAIGAGCFLIEVQEPTDYTLRTERTTPEGRTIPELLIHQGAGLKSLFDCFHYDSFTEEETIAKWRKEPQTIYSSIDSDEAVLIGEDTTTLFGMNRINVRVAYQSAAKSTFAIAVIVKGAGEIAWEDGSLIVRQGDFLFMPVGIGSVRWTAASGTELQIVVCTPPFPVLGWNGYLPSESLC
ncbi:mannose-6-phosphate isomerase [Paenibacillus psychroresistens]|uniref:Mannose-6-phosphate isomerase n=1 Tax=Paenibacillus psychroresistens TaxID=1778678 RepID=A0A6B8RT92_9BACL|nr:class I mannose-6-phosphate isomerase [Paenibacillus psychroresistens]QGQ98428.1 mannose-6-phosphate isomerase [Paenibacillus psychroresistens]